MWTHDPRDMEPAGIDHDKLRESCESEILALLKEYSDLTGKPVNGIEYTHFSMPGNFLYPADFTIK